MRWTCLRAGAPGHQASRHTAGCWIASIFDLDFMLLARRGVRGILFDVDNTLVAPRGKRIAPSLAEFLLRERDRAGIEQWALASNSRRDLSPLAHAIDADIVRARLLSAKPRAAYFHRALSVLGMHAHEVVMVGDKILHDIEPASRLGMHTVLVRPFAEDQLVDRLLFRRRRERAARVLVEAVPPARPDRGAAPSDCLTEVAKRHTFSAPR
jgi:HAD superfamily phosphatase (TIGR01668 family)